MIIEGNRIIECTNPTNKYKTSIQGIGIFDGLYTRLRVVNNIVDATLYHGIGILGPADSLIANNTVIGATSTWIAIFDSKEGRPPVNTIVRNSIAFKYILPPGFGDHNITMTNGADLFVKFNYAAKDYDFHPKGNGVAARGGAPISSLKYDIEDKLRPITAPSAGA